MNQTTKSLFDQVHQLHDANVQAAKNAVENAVHIGVLLHQIKEEVGHGQFGDSMKTNAPEITDRSCRNYMRLAEERLIEETARQLLPAPGENPPNGKSETVSDLVALPENAIPMDAWERAQKQVAEMNWSQIPAEMLPRLVRNISNKSLTDMYRDYGIVRAKEPTVYHPPRKLTPDERVAAEDQQAAALLDNVLHHVQILTMDIESKAGLTAARIHPKRWKEFSRSLTRLNKQVKPLTRRKKSPAEKKVVGRARTPLRADPIKAPPAAVLTH